ncbi:MAG: hypothetical protein IK012_02585 [Fibrobacter sp.]|uniref:hypothetical protein n=1 Tax=Fibrobacter sp. TaxID=35828 RepID=UPI0025BF835C|nr:hypothetical protein [Fibrobacter sp.]MBR4784124.1 hypothetical protein [Fibrobacter sp.]
MNTEPKDPKDYYKQKLTIKDLRPGDILTFEGEDDHGISSAIMMLTNSKVTHGALYFQDSPVEALADAGQSGLHAHEVIDKEDSRCAYVCRLQKNDKGDLFSDSELYPVLHSAKGYLDLKMPYPYSDLVLLAMILIFKDISHVNIKQHVIIGILKIVAAEIKKLIDEKKHKGEHTMVCSSFVYQCYLDASKNNKDLKIKLSNSDMHVLKCANQAQTLFNLYAEHAAENNFETSRFMVQEEDDSVNDLEALLKEALEDNGNSRVMLMKTNILSRAIEDFLMKLLDYLGYKFKSIKELIENARELQSMFVTPNDLCYNIDNAEKVGYINLYRATEDLAEDQITTKYNKEP